MFEKWKCSVFLPNACQVSKKCYYDNKNKSFIKKFNTGTKNADFFADFEFIEVVLENVRKKLLLNVCANLKFLTSQF